MRDFLNERMRAYPAADSSMDTILSMDSAWFRAALPAEIGQVLAARWNACADALAYLEALPHATNEELDVRAILRRAIRGEG